MFPRRLVAPALDRATYRRWTYLILGGALIVPYLLFAMVLVPSLLPIVTTTGAAATVGGALALVAMAASSFIPAVRSLEGAAVRELLDDPAPGATFGPTHSWPVRLRSTVMFLLHVFAGGVLSFLTLALPAMLALSVAAEFGEVTTGVPLGDAWFTAALVAATVLLVYAVSLSGKLLARAATALLGVTASERIEQLERRTGQLAERNRLARELHDSVGHALSVVTIQAGAARRTLRTDPDFTEQALLAIEESARGALDELDHVLGLLRDEVSGKAPQAGLAELPALLSAAELAGVSVAAELHGDLESVPPVVSREIYRILQEALTNVLRHAGKVPVTLRVAVVGRWVELAVRNPMGDDAVGRPGGGRGLRGMAERVEVLRGTLSAGRDDDHWEVAAKLPWGREPWGRKK